MFELILTIYYSQDPGTTLTTSKMSWWCGRAGDRYLLSGYVIKNVVFVPRQVTAQLKDVFGVGEANLNEYNGILKGDVAACVALVKKALKFDGNDDASKLFGTRTSNPLRQDGSQAPSFRLSRTETEQSTEDYVEGMLRTAVRSNMPTAT